jgi:DNA polymerase III sliding clamp (beta) subunit (PCNA family)
MKTNVEIPVADLKFVLPGLAKVVSKKTSLPVLSCVKVTLNPDRTLHIQANNLDQILTARLTKPFKGTPGTMLVPFEELTSIAKRCSANDTIELSTTGKETAIIYPAAGTRINKPLAHLGVHEFPPATEVNTEPVKLDDAFKEALHEALDCASEDQSRYVINGACLDVRSKEAHYVVGTNGHHLFSANSFLFDVPQSIIIPPGKFLTWPGFVDDGPWTLRFQPEVKGKGKARVNYRPAWVRLDSDHWTFVAKPIEGEYPNWKQVVPAADCIKSRITLAEPGIKIILDALPLLPGQDDRNQPVSLEIKGEYLTLKAKGSAKEWTEIPIPAKVSGLPVTVPLNRTYLAKALKFGCTEIGIEDKVSPVKFTTNGKTFVVCPLGDPDAKKVPATSPVSPQENTSAPATPAATNQPVEQTASQPTPEPPTERNEMPRTARTTTSLEPVARGSLTNQAQHNGNGNGTNSPVKSLVDQVEGIKDNLRGAIRD